jgi:hypothetical protein
MVSAAKQTVVAFQSDYFDLSEEIASVMSPGRVGEDVGAWLIEKLQAAGHATDPAPAAADFGWYANFTVEGQALCALIGHVPTECWFIVVEARRGFLGSLFGGNRRVPIASVLAIRDAIALIPDVRRIRWYSVREFRSRQWLDQSGARSPDPA